MNRALMIAWSLITVIQTQAQGGEDQTPKSSASLPAPSLQPGEAHFVEVDLKAEVCRIMDGVLPYTESDGDSYLSPEELWYDGKAQSSLVFLTPGELEAGTGATDPQDEAQPVKPRLLPDNMSFLERALWGEEGFFRSVGMASPLTPEVRKHELAVRRTMLTMHQIGGFATLGSMIATVYFGQKFLDTGQRNARDMHQTFIPITIGLYGTTALLSVLSPPPLIRRDEVSTTTIHKTLAWIHAAGMIVTPILGMVIERRSASYNEQARVHQISAYITTAVFTAAMITIML